MSAAAGFAFEGKGFVLRQVSLHASALSAPLAHHDSDGFARYDLTVADGHISSIVPSSSFTGVEANLMGGRIVLPAFIDCHTHLDKGHIWPRSPNPDGSFMGALTTVGADRAASWSARDVEARMEFALRCAYAHGTRAIRTHLDSIAPQETISWPVFEAMRESWKGKIELQAASLIGIEEARNAQWLESLAARVRAARGVLGAVTYMVPDLDELLDRIFGLAAEYELELDFHADETGDTSAISLRHIAEAALRHGYENRILVGHCCSLAQQPDDLVKHTLDRVAEAGISVVSLPMCNMYLQDRRADETTPRWRGITLLHEMKTRGINICVASDNTRDPFYAYGDLDMLEVYRMATRAAHFDHPVGDWPKTVLSNAGRAMGLDDDFGMLREGGPADFIVFRGRSWTELLSRPESHRIVVRNGEPVDAELPDYAELDHLMEAV